MATHGCSRMKYIDICRTAFYFTEVGTDVDEDTFDKSTFTIDRCLIGSSWNKFLVLREKRFQAKNLSSAERDQPECKFNIQIYKNGQETENWRAVILYAIKDNKKILVSCKNADEISAEEMDLPEHIPDGAHGAVFFKRELKISNKYLLQSSLYPTKFLAFEPDEHDQTLSKLVLHEKPEDKVDEATEVSIIRSN